MMRFPSCMRLDLLCLPKASGEEKKKKGYKEDVLIYVTLYWNLYTKQDGQHMKCSVLLHAL